jgi:hypothetical protein
VAYYSPVNIREVSHTREIYHTNMTSITPYPSLASIHTWRNFKQIHIHLASTTTSITSTLREISNTSLASIHTLENNNLVDCCIKEPGGYDE